MCEAQADQERARGDTGAGPQTAEQIRRDEREERAGERRGEVEVGNVGARVGADQAHTREGQRRAKEQLTPYRSAPEGEGGSREHEGDRKERDRSRVRQGREAPEGDRLDPDVAAGRKPEDIVDSRPERPDGGEVEDHRRRNEADPDDRAQESRAGPGQGEKKGDDGQAKERAAHRGDYGSGAGEQASEEGRPSARRATERPRGAVEEDAFIAEPDDVAKDGGADRARDQRDGVEQRIAEEGTRSGFEAETSAHGVSMQGRSH